MKWSWRVGQIRGIDIKIHFTFVFALIWGATIWGGGLEGAIYGVFLTLALFGFVLLHELGHSLMARRYGIEVVDIVLLPIGGAARLSRMPDVPSQELAVALAGPAVNLALMLLAAPIVVAGLAGQAMAGAEIVLPVLARPGLVNFAWFVLAINLSLLLFNMIPAFPMDGGRVLRALLAMKLSYGRATRFAAAVGQVFAVLFGVYGIASGNWSLALVAVFVYMAAGSESQETVIRERLRAFRVGEAVAGQSPTLPAGLPAHVAFDRIMRSPYRALAVVDDAGAYLGHVTRGGLQRRWARGLRGDLSLFVEPSGPALDCDASLEEARWRMAESEATMAPVFCSGQFAGLIDIETIGRMVTMQRQGRWFGARAAPHSSKA